MKERLSGNGSAQAPKHGSNLQDSTYGEVAAFSRVLVEKQISNGSRKWYLGLGWLVELALVAAVLAAPIYMTESMQPVVTQVLPAEETRPPVWLVPKGYLDGQKGIADPNSSGPTIPTTDRPRVHITRSDAALWPVRNFVPGLPPEGGAVGIPTPGDSVRPYGHPEGQGRPGLPWDGRNPIGTGPPPPPDLVYQIGGDVKAPTLLHKVRPVYPPLAQRLGIAGEVVLVAVIEKDGSVRVVETSSGPALLAAAAKKAVGQWRYAPSRLNGHAIAVELVITVQFHR